MALNVGQDGKLSLLSFLAFSVAFFRHALHMRPYGHTYLSGHERSMLLLGVCWLAAWRVLRLGACDEAVDTARGAGVFISNSKSRPDGSDRPLIHVAAHAWWL